MGEKLLIPNTTQIPNLILDHLLPALAEPETKCILYICRRTFGFGKSKDRISLSQFTRGIKTKDGQVLDHGTGLSRPAVVWALQRLVAAGVIYTEQTTKGNFFELNLNLNIEAALKIISDMRLQQNKERKEKPKQTTLFKVVNRVNQLTPLTKSGKRGLPKVVNEVNPQNQEKPSNKTKTIATADAAATVDKKQHKPHTEFIEFWHNTVKQTRGIKPLIAPMDGKNLKRVLEMNILTPLQLQQLAIYFLAHGSFKSFNPSISVLLSNGILNGLMNRMQNDPNFWRELDSFSTHYLRQPSKNNHALVGRLAELKAKLFVMK
jgi:DNA-binding transcriptional ArsR family regulator